MEAPGVQRRKETFQISAGRCWRERKPCPLIRDGSEVRGFFLAKGKRCLEDENTKLYQINLGTNFVDVSVETPLRALTIAFCLFNCQR